MKKILLVLILISMLTSYGCALDSNNTPESKANDDTVTTINDEITAETELQSKLEPVDYGGVPFRVLCSISSPEFYVPFSEMTAEEMNGEIVNDAVFMRNLEIEEKYNVVITAKEADGLPKVSENLIKTIKAGEDLYDIALPNVNSAFTLAIGGYTYEIHDIPNINLSEPWWSDIALEDSSVAGKNYYLIGDVNVQAMNAVGIMYFNKDLAAQYSLTSPYKLVNDGEWTFDNIEGLLKNVTVDLDGDGVMSEKDQYGLGGNSAIWASLFYGADENFVAKDSDDYPVLDLFSGNKVSTLEKIITLLNDDTMVLYGEKYGKLMEDGRTKIPRFAFLEGRELIWIEISHGIHELRQMDNDCGILPLPKYDEAQENYSSYYHVGLASTVVIPVTNTNLDMTGMILEDMGYYSHTIIKPQFYETLLKNKISRDNESAEILDVVFGNIHTDIGYVYCGIDGYARELVNKNNMAIVSFLQSKEKETCQ